MTAGTLLTIEDFERLPDEVAENHELVDGVLIDVSGNTPRHNWLRDALTALLRAYVLAKKLGMVFSEQEYDFQGNAHGPDVTFISPPKTVLLDFDKRVQRFVPDLAAEIASPNDTYSSLLRRKERCLRCGTREVWLISPETREVTVYVAGGCRLFTGSDAITTDLLPGFSMTVDDLFEGL